MDIKTIKLKITIVIKAVCSIIFILSLNKKSRKLMEKDELRGNFFVYASLIRIFLQIKSLRKTDNFFSQVEFIVVADYFKIPSVQYNIVDGFVSENVLPSH